MKTLLLNLSTTCDNFTTPANHPTKGEFQEGSKTIISSPSTLDAKNGFSAGVVIGAILVMATGLMLVGVGVKKCYERHLNRRLEYSYAQLTIDMLDDDDDHLILPWSSGACSSFASHALRRSEISMSKTSMALLSIHSIKSLANVLLTLELMHFYTINA